MDFRSISLGFVVVMAALAVGAGDVAWKASNGVWDGVWTDTTHWSGATATTGLPAAGDYSVVKLTSGGTLSMPSGGLTTQSEMRWFFYNGHDAVLDATGSSYTIGPAADGYYYGSDANKRPWYLYIDGGTFGYISYAVSAYDEIKSLSVIQMTNATMTTSATLGESAEVVFAGQGVGASLVDMCDPVGGRKSGALPSLTVFASSDAFQNESGYPVARMVFKDIDSVLPSVSLTDYPFDLAHMLFSGGSHTILGNMTLDGGSSTRVGRTLFEVTDGASLAFGQYGNLSIGRYRPCQLLVTDGAVAELRVVSYASYGANMSFVATNGATLKFGHNAMIGSTKNDTVSVDDVQCCSTASVRVVDSTLGICYNWLHFGNPNANEGAHSVSLALTNALVVATNSANSTDVYFHNGSFVSKDTDWTASILTMQANNSTVPPVFTFDGGTMNISNRLEMLGLSDSSATVYTNRFVQESGTVHVPTYAQFIVGKYYGSSVYELRGGTLDLEKCSGRIANSAGARGELIVDGDDARLFINGTRDHLYVGTGAGAVGVFRLRNGSVDIDSGTMAHRVFVSGAANATSIVEIAGGTFTANTGYGLGATFGTSIIDISGGETALPRFAVGTEFVSTPESVVTISGGTLNIPAAATTTLSPAEQLGIQITGNKGTNRLVRLRLNGGVVNVNRIVGGVGSQCNGGTGWTAIEGNGGRVVLNGTGYQMINGFDEATLGSKGLEIDSNGYAAHIYQSFADMSGESGALVLAGDGTKTLYGANSTESVLVAAGGSVVFADGARHESALVVTNGASVTFSDASGNGITALTVGDSSTYGTLNLTAGTTITVDGPVTINSARLALSGDFTTGDDYTLLASTQEFSDETKLAWSEAVARGLGDSQACDLEYGTDSSGNHILKMHVREANNLVITVDSGTSNVAANVIYGSSETLTTVIAEDATLNLQGDVGSGALVKTGDGRTVLSSQDNIFLQGITISGGMLSGTSLAALGFGSVEADTSLTLGTATLSLGSEGESGTSPYDLTLNTTDATDAAVILCNADVTMGAPSCTQGCTIKRGPGRLVYETDEMVVLGVNGGTQIDKNAAPAKTTIVFDENGIPPTVQYTTLNVAEGDLVLRGTSSSAHFKVGSSALASTYVGMPVQGISKQARLIVDGAKATPQYNAHFHLGSGCAGSTSDVTAPALILTNGATFVTTSFRNGLNADNSYHGRVFVDASTLDFSEYLYALMSGTEVDGEPTWTFTNGSQLLSPNDNKHAVEFAGRPCTILFDNSTFKGRSNVASGRGRVWGAGANGTMIFRNGSVFMCDTFVWDTSASTVTLEFDDGAWDPSDSDYTFTAGDNASRLIVKATGTGPGLVLAPPSGVTWTMAQTVTGDGGVTKDGEGTLAFSAAPAFSGVLDVVEGTVSFDGLETSGLTLTGSGVVSGGTLSAATYKVSLDDEWTATEQLTFSGVTFSGRTTVDLGRAEETALAKPYGTNVAIATYTGSAPDVSNWRAANTGVRGLTGIFTAADGVIRMNLALTVGTTIMLR